MITASVPPDWRELQEQVADILHKCRFTVQVEKRIPGARGTIEVDVYAEEIVQGRKYTIACECKHWKADIPQREIHAFRTVLSDIGANVGYIITTSRFQTGAITASELTNIKLLDWQGFQDEFERTWYARHFMDHIEFLCRPAVTCGHYSVHNLPEPQQTQISSLLDEYNAIVSAVGELTGEKMMMRELKLPLEDYKGWQYTNELLERIPDDIKRISGYRDLLYRLVEEQNNLHRRARNIVPNSFGYVSFMPWNSPHIFDRVSEEEWDRIAARFCRTAKGDLPPDST